MTIKLPVTMGTDAVAWHITDAAERLVAYSPESADAAAIVRAVNALPACVAAMEAAERYFLRWDGAGPSLQDEEHAETLGTIRLALAAAKGGA